MGLILQILGIWFLTLVALAPIGGLCVGRPYVGKVFTGLAVIVFGPVIVVAATLFNVFDRVSTYFWGQAKHDATVTDHGSYGVIKEND
jgi:hypothetical protein